MKDLSKPTKDWGPAALENKLKRFDTEVQLTPKIIDNGELNFTFDFNAKIPLSTIPRTQSVENNSTTAEVTDETKRLSNGSLSKSETTLPTEPIYKGPVTEGVRFNVPGPKPEESDV